MDSKKTGYGILKVLLLVSSSACGSDPVVTVEPAQMTVIRPHEYARALRNPLKGLTNRGFSEQNEWASLAHSYIRWNEEILSNVVDEGRLSIGVNGPRKRTYPGGLVDFYAAFLSCSSPSAKVSPPNSVSRFFSTPDRPRQVTGNQPLKS